MHFLCAYAFCFCLWCLYYLHHRIFDFTSLRRRQDVRDSAGVALSKDYLNLNSYKVWPCCPSLLYIWLHNVCAVPYVLLEFRNDVDVGLLFSWRADVDCVSSWPAWLPPRRLFTQSLNKCFFQSTNTCFQECQSGRRWISQDFCKLVLVSEKHVRFISMKLLYAGMPIKLDVMGARCFWHEHEH